MTHSVGDRGSFRPQAGSIPTEREEWTVGQHLAMSSGWIVRPVLFGSRVRVLPECEGGHVVIKSERDARLIAAAPALLEALRYVVRIHSVPDVLPENQPHEISVAMAAIQSATGEG